MSDDDPFENLDPPEDREGDPFENLGPVDGDDGVTGEETDDGDGAAGHDTADGPDGQPDAPPGEPDDVADDFWDEMRDADRIGTDSAAASGVGPDPGSGIEGSDGPQTTDEGGKGPSAGADPTVPTGEPPAESEPADEATDDAPDFEEAFVEGDTVGAGDGPAGLGEDDPFADLGERGGDPFGEGESVFEQVDVEELDVDELWELLEDDEGAPSAVNHPVEVSKHRFCEQCEFFSGPPNAHCTNEEAEILEYIGMDQVRVIDCPIVAEQRRLENEE